MSPVITLTKLKNKQITTVCLLFDYNDKVEHSLSHPPAGRDAGHDDALRSWGGHSLESALPKLLKELLLLQLLEDRCAAL